MSTIEILENMDDTTTYGATAIASEETPTPVVAEPVLSEAQVAEVEAEVVTDVEVKTDEVSTEDHVTIEGMQAQDDTPATKEPEAPVVINPQGYSIVDFRVKSPRDFKAVIKGMACLTDEATLEFNAEGMTFRGMDPSHVALIDINWPSMCFEAYECNGTCKIGVRIDELSKILADFDDKKDSLALHFDPEDGTNMLTLDSRNGNKVKLHTSETSASSTPLPKLNFNTKVVMNCKVLDKTYKALAKVSEFVSLKSDVQKVEFAGKGDSGEMTKVFEGGSEGLEELGVKEDSRAMFSLDYLARAHRALKGLDESVVLEYSTKMPIRVEYRLNQVGRIHYYVAPRVQDD